MKRPWILWAVYAAVLVIAPMVWSSSLALTMLTQMGIAIIACLAYNVLLGQGGMLSFGHAVYSGLGSYFAIHTLNMIGDGSLALPVSLVPLVGGLLSDRDAYSYLPRSVAYLPPTGELLSTVHSAGFVDIERTLLTGGIAQLITARRA